jgi:hypothetical protein
MLPKTIAIADIVVAAVTLLATTPAVAATLHVSTSGNDSDVGAENSPLRTLQKAASLVRAGDTVIVHAGVYKGHLILRRSGVPDKPIVFKNATGEKPVFDGEGKGRIELQSEEGWRKPIGWITVEGFEVRNGWDGIKFYNAHHIVLKGNYIHDNLNQGILGNGHDVRIEGNVVARNGFKSDNERSNLEHGIYCTGSKFTIVNNVIHSNKAYGIQVAGYPYKPDYHAGREFADARGWLISNNTFAFNENRGGIVVWQDGAAECVIQNNIFYKNAVRLGKGDIQGIDFVGAGSGHVIRSNLFFAPGRASIDESNARSATNNIEQKEPAFVDAERFDFRLRKGSPAIDAGARDRAPQTDIDGRKRPQERGVDVGAYEARN